METIFALASARGKSGIAVIRISGRHAFAAVGRLCGQQPEMRRATLRKLVWGGEVLDEAVVVLFASGASFTGEESAELQVHGSPAVISAVLRALGDQPELRMAEAGEFTRRALENGNLDLTQVEGLADLINAETEAQRKQAVRILSGALRVQVDLWRRDLLRAAALIEATIDFADEDVPTDVRPEVSALLKGLLGSLHVELAGVQAAERIRDGFEVAIVGQPNVGKSTLLNMLAGREAAITSEIAGTTRDIIEVRMDLSGLSVTLMDTAGLRDAVDPIESIGIDRTVARARAADLRVFLLGDGDEVPMLMPEVEDIVLRGKGDLYQGVETAVSGLTGAGTDALIARISDCLSRRAASAGLLIRERQRNALLIAERAIRAADDILAHGEDRAELVAAELRLAMRAMESLVGRIDVESLLDEIFSKFCIGK